MCNVVIGAISVLRKRELCLWGCIRVCVQCMCVCKGVGVSVRGSIFCKAFKLGYWSLQLLQELL